MGVQCAQDPILSTQRIPGGRDPDLIYTKNLGVRDPIYLHKEKFPRCAHHEFLKKNHDKSMIYLKIFRAARANLLRVSLKNHEKTMWKMFRTARANLLRDSLDSSLETSWKINDISKNENGNPIEINGLITSNSKSNETQIKTKWTSIEKSET